MVEYYQLAHNERHPQTKKPVAKIIHSFGRADRLDREEPVRLCTSIARVCGVQVVDSLDQDLGAPGVFPEGFKLIRTMNLGWMLVVKALWELLGIGGKLREICKRQEVGLIFYDTTTVGFSSDQQDDEDGLRRFGKSKEGGWNPQGW